MCVNNEGRKGSSPLFNTVNVLETKKDLFIVSSRTCNEGLFTRGVKFINRFISIKKTKQN